MSSSKIAITATTDELQPVARELAQRLALPLAVAGDAMLLSVAPYPTAPGYRLQLQPPGAGAVEVDFVGGKSGHRRRAGEGRRQPLARAVGMKPGVTPRVIDATGGLGRDAFVLAMLGCTVKIIERSPIVAALLDNGLARAMADPDTAPIAARLTLIQDDARDVLRALAPAECPNAIYLDPMYPERTKSALVKKEMRALQALLGADADSGELLEVALTRARNRVVVKRPRHAPALGTTKPHHTVESPNTRYDIYLTNV